MEAWDAEPFSIDHLALADVDNDMAEAVEIRRFETFDVQYMTFRVLYDIRNALYMIHQELEKKNND